MTWSDKKALLVQFMKIDVIKHYTAPATGNVKMKRVYFCSKRVCDILHATLEEEEIFVSKKTWYCLLRKFCTA